MFPQPSVWRCKHFLCSLYCSLPLPSVWHSAHLHFYGANSEVERATLNIALVNQLCSSNTIPQTSAPVRILQGQSRRCYEPHSLWMRGENHSPGLPKAKGFSLGGPGAAPGTQGRSIGLGMNTIHSIITTDVTRRSKNCALTPVKVKFVPGTRSFYCSDSSPIG